MTQINLKFTPKNEELVYNGYKCATTRDEPKGKVGDVFPIRDRMYRIVDIFEIAWHDMYDYYRVDGFHNVRDYIKEVQDVYPDVFKPPEKGEPIPVLYVHFFAYVGDKK
jgi:hypothetical protein